jgi:hypothetical protein
MAVKSVFHMADLMVVSRDDKMVGMMVESWVDLMVF